jgi:hypothetical protein
VDEEEQLRAVVEAQAEARVRGDMVAFASRMTPQALLRLHRTGAGPRDAHGRRFELLSVEESGDAGNSEVRFHGRGSYVLRSHWERRDGHWMATLVETPADLRRPSFWQRVWSLVGGTPASPERRDLQ